MNSTDQFEAIVDKHYEGLYRFAMSLTRVESDAQDLTQQTFYIWATKGHQLRDFSKVKTWLYTTLHRAFLETKRRGNKFQHCELEEVSHELPVFSPELTHLDSSQALSALAQVDPVYQGAVALFYLEDYSYKDIAEILAVPVGTVKSRVARGIMQLRGILGSVRPEPLSVGQRAGQCGSVQVREYRGCVGDDANSATRRGGFTSYGSKAPPQTRGFAGAQPFFKCSHWSRSCS